MEFLRRRFVEFQRELDGYFLGGHYRVTGRGGFVGDTVLFGSTTGSTARLDGADPSVAAVTFNNAAMGYTIAQGSGGSLTLQGGVAPGELATVAVLAGNHAISAPLQLASDTVFSAAAASSLTVTGRINGSGSLTVNGGGKIYLSGSNGYTGGTSVAGGTLIITTVAALPDGGNIVVGSDSSFASGGVAHSQQTSTAESAAVATAGLTTNSAVLPAASSTTTEHSPTASFVGPSQSQFTTRAVNNGPKPLSVSASGPKLLPAWLSAIAQVWSEQRQSVGPAKARAVDIVMMMRNT